MAKARKSGGRYNIYKKGAAVQFSLSKGYRDPDNNSIVNAGVVWMEIAPASGEKNDNGNRIYDWEHKITMALGITDIETILYYPTHGGNSKREEETTQIIHENPRNGAYSSIKIQPGQQSGWKLSVNKKLGDDNVGQFIYLSDSEFYVLRSLLGSAIPHVVGWAT